VGISLASRVSYIFVCVGLRCVECRAGTSIFGHFAGVGGGTVRVFCLLGSVLACVVRLNRWGWRDSTIFLVSLALFLAGTVRLKWQGCAVISFSFSLVSCHYSWRVDMRGRDIAFLFFLLWYFVAVSCSFFIFKLLIVDNLLQEVSEDLVP
jgi:hypothetical protein